MCLLDQYISNLKQKLAKCGYDDDYIQLCEQYSTRLLQNRLPVIFDRDHLSLLLGLKKKYLKTLIILSDKLYNDIDIPKKQGGYRTIDIPIEGLKYIQRWILDNILYNIPISRSSTGFVPKKSIKENAEKHVNKDCVITFDIKDFFPTVYYEQNRPCYRKNQISLAEKSDHPYGEPGQFFFCSDTYSSIIKLHTAV